MSLYRTVDTEVWDDDKFNELDDVGKLTWLLLLTGPQTTQVPGLQQADALTLASALRKPPELVQERLDEIEAKGMAQFDRKRRMIRLPAGPKRNPPVNPNQLKGIWDAWQRLPDCDLRASHVDSIREAGDGKPWFAESWSATFGKVNETLSKGFLNHFGNRFEIGEGEGEGEGLSKTAAASPAAGPEQEALKLEEPSKAKKPKASGPDVGSLIVHYCKSWVDTRKPRDGKPPALTSVDRNQAASLVRAHGLEASKRLVDRYLTDGDAFLTNNGHPLRLLAGRANAYRQTATPRRAGYAGAPDHHHTENRIVTNEL